MLEGLSAIDLVNLNLKESTSSVGGSASPFIEEGDGFTGERERVRMLRSLVAHADEEWIMVGTHNTVDVTIECQMHVGGYVLFGYGRYRYLLYC